MDPAQLLELIKTRRSVRRFRARPVDPELVQRVLEAGRWAPSGLNNQPWRFVLVRQAGLKERLASLTRYGRVISSAPLLIVVFIHRPSMYDEVKDHQAMGACIQNMLLMAHGLGLGAVWLGEILKNRAKVRDILGLESDLALMAVVALGWPDDGERASQRMALAELMLAAPPSEQPQP